MWKYKMIIDNYYGVINFLNENNIKPENCKILDNSTEVDIRYAIFYYVDSKK